MPMWLLLAIAYVVGSLFPFTKFTGMLKKA